MRKLTILILVAAVVAAVVAPLAEINQTTQPRGIDQLLFFPSKHPEGNWNPADLQFEDVFFRAADGTILHGWFCRAGNPVATVLFAHGNAGNISTRTPLLRRLQSDLRLSVFIFDYRGYGRSNGIPTVAGALDDARAARAALCKRASVAESDLILMGESLGGALMVQLAVESTPRALILQSTFSSLRDVAEVHYREYAARVHPAVLNSVSWIGQVDSPLFQSHGENDRVIPFALGEKLFQSAREPKVFLAIPGRGHNDWITDDYLLRLEEFVSDVS